MGEPEISRVTAGRQQAIQVHGVRLTPSPIHCVTVVELQQLPTFLEILISATSVLIDTATPW